MVTTLKKPEGASTFRFLQFHDYLTYDKVKEEIEDAYLHVIHDGYLPTFGEIMEAVESMFHTAAVDFIQYLIDPSEEIEFKMGYDQLSGVALDFPLDSDEGNWEDTVDSFLRQLDTKELRRMFEQDIRFFLEEIFRFSFIDIHSSSLAAVKYQHDYDGDISHLIFNQPTIGVW